MDAPTRPRTVIEAVAAHAAARPHRRALAVYHGRDAELTALDYAELDRRARMRARDLAERIAPGERVLLALSNGPEFVEAYLGCLHAGLVAVPVPAPGGSATAAERVAAVAADCAPAAALVLPGDREALAAQLGKRGLGALPVTPALPVEPGDPGPPAHPGPGPEDLAVLQYSSGSTGKPKGVMLSHRNIMTNMAMIARAFESGPEDVAGGWLPLYHDMGLFGLLTDGLVFGGGAAVMPTGEFLRRPAEWLWMLDRCGVTMAAVPDFALDMCTRRIPDAALEGLDLSRLRLVCDGSEPVNPAVVEAFSERFGAYGLGSTIVAPAYGMAEAVLLVCVKGFGAPRRTTLADRARLEARQSPALVPAAEGAAAVRLSSLGRPVLCDVRIVDPETETELPAGAVGEIWLRGENLARGYWNRPKLNARDFAARLMPDGEPGWLRTGDLGALHDGELYVTGRIKELIIVRGRNLFPQDLEREAHCAHEALAGLMAAAFSVPAPDERVVLVHEVSPKVPETRFAEIAAQVRRRITTEFGVPCRNVLLVRRGGVHRTTSGKIQRAGMRAAFLAGELAAVHAELDPEVQALVVGGPA